MHLTTTAATIRWLGEIEELTEREGWVDTGALRSVLRIVLELRPGSPEEPGHMHEELGGVESRASILFSAYKHERWSGGYEQIRHFVRCDCARLRTN